MDMLRERFGADLLRLEKQIHERYGMNAAAFDANGARVTAFVNWGNSLCPVIKGNPVAASAICAVANGHFMRQARTTGKPAMGECDAGLCKFCVPVKLNGDFLGVVGGCGRLLAPGEVDSLCVASASGLSGEKVGILSRDCRPMSEEELAEAVAFVRDEVSRMVSGVA